MKERGASLPGGSELLGQSIEADWSLVAELLKLRHQKWTPGKGVNGSGVMRKTHLQISS